MSGPFSFLRTPSSRAARAAFVAATASLTVGTALAIRGYGEPFDWPYQVISTLASAKHNPAGARYFAYGLGLAMVCLWPVTAWLRDRVKRLSPSVRIPRATFGLEVGLICGALLAVEHLLFTHISDVFRKAHEITALLTFLGLYVGVISHLVVRVRQHDRTSRASMMSLAGVAAPVVAIGASQLALYLGQRDLGWVDRSWREMGVPLWKSFAFWQWLAVAALWAATGWLLAEKDSGVSSQDSAGGERNREARI